MTAPKDPQIIQSVVMTMRVVECLAANDGEMGVTEIARALSIPKARIFRHLHTLRHLGYVDHNPATKKDRIGIRLHLLAKMVGDDLDMAAAVRPALEALRDQTAQTVVFAPLIDGKPTILDFALGTTVVQFTFRPGTSFNLNSAALGHIALAFGPEELWQRVDVDAFEAETPHTQTDPAALPARVEMARKRGWTIVPEEAVMGVNAIAVPVFHHDASFAGSLAIVGSVQHIRPDPPADLVAQVIAAGKQASWNLGWRSEDSAGA